MRRLLLAAVALSALALAAPREASAQATYKVVSACGSASYTAGSVNYATMDTVGNACGNSGGEPGPAPSNITQWDSIALGAPSNFGTSPGAVTVPGVNASVMGSAGTSLTQGSGAPGANALNGFSTLQQGGSLLSGSNGLPVTLTTGSTITATSTNSTIVSNQAKIATTGTAVQFQSASAALSNGLTFCASTSNNSSGITVGGSGVTNTTNGTGNGAVLYPGQCNSIGISNANLLYVNGTAGDIITFLGN